MDDSPDFFATHVLQHAQLSQYFVNIEAVASHNTDHRNLLIYDSRLAILPTEKRTHLPID